MKLPVNYADVRMGQLLQHIQISYEMAKDEESKHTIIELLHFVSGAITNLTKGPDWRVRIEKHSGKLYIDLLSGGFSTTDTLT